MKTAKRNGLLMALMCVCAGMACADTHYADTHCANPVSPFLNWSTAATSIQDAIDAASAYDTVLVATGTYQPARTICIGDGITVRGNGDRTDTVIDGQGAMRCIEMSNSACLNSLTVYNGYLSAVSNGAGIACYDGTVADCLVISNHVFAGPADFTPVSGGGIYCENSVVSNCGIVANSTGGSFHGSDDDGGGIAGLASEIVQCDVRQNRSISAGAGISVKESSTVSGCTFENNLCLSGAAVMSEYSTVSNCIVVRNEHVGIDSTESLISDCFIGHNSNDWQSLMIGPQPPLGGGGIRINGCTVERCTIVSNEAPHGGGVYIYRAGTFGNCVITDNISLSGKTSPFAPADGAGVYMNSAGAVVHCTIAENTTLNSTGGIYLKEGLDPPEDMEIVNCVSYGNSGFNLSTIVPNATVEHSCIEGRGDLADGCITNDPLFLSIGDYHLSSNSPCIDSGTNHGGVVVDIYRAQRPLDGNNDGDARPDMGACEFIHYDADTDSDGMRDVDEIASDTDPVDPGSMLRIEGLARASGTRVDWQGGSSVTQLLERATSLVGESWAIIFTNDPPTSPSMSWTDPDGTNCPGAFYRLRVP